jgi:hypothetical protein
LEYHDQPIIEQIPHVELNPIPMMLMVLNLDKPNKIFPSH